MSIKKFISYAFVDGATPNETALLAATLLRSDCYILEVLILVALDCAFYI